MEKFITITDKDGTICITSGGFTCMELLGVLRFQEKALWLRMIEKQSRQIKEAKEKEIEKFGEKFEKAAIKTKPIKKKSSPKKKPTLKKKKK